MITFKAKDFRVELAGKIKALRYTPNFFLKLLAITGLAVYVIATIAKMLW